MIKRRRLALGLTQEQLAQRAGVTKNYVTMVERGTRKGVSLLLRVQLAEALGIPPTQVLTAQEAQVLELMLGAALSREGAEAVVWQVQRCLESEERPTVSEASARVALRKLM